MGKIPFLLIGLIGLGSQGYTQGPDGGPRLSLDTAYVEQWLREAGRIPGNLFPDSAIAQYGGAAALARKVYYPRGIVYARIKMAEYKNKYKNDYAGSLHTMAAALPYLDKLEEKDRYLIPTMYNLMGIVRYNMALYDSAVYYYKQGLSSMDSLNIVNPNLKGHLFNNIGVVFAVNRQYATSIAYLKKAAAVDGLDSAIYAMQAANIGNTYANMIHDMDSAMYWWVQAVHIYASQQAKEPLQQLYTNMSIGWQSPKHQDLDKAARYLDSAIRIDPAKLDSNHLMLRAGAYLDFYQEAYDRAIDKAKRLIALVWATTGDRYEIKDGYWLLAFCYEHTGHTQKARYYQNEYMMLDDSLNSEDIQRSINALEVKYRMAEKDRSLALSHARIYQQRNWLILSVGGALLLLGFFFYYRKNSLQRQRLDTEKIKSLEQDRKIEALNIRMDAEASERIRISRELHDGMGVLISAAGINYTLLKKQITPDTPYLEPIYADGTEILERMRQELYHVAHNLVPEYYLAHKGLVDALNDLVAHVSKDDFEVSVSEFGIPREMHPGRGFVLYRVLEEIISNAIRHSDGTRLELQFVYHEDKVHILAEDNGKGFDQDKVQAGIGLDNIERRIAQLNGTVTRYAKAGKGVSYSMVIPY